MARRCARPAADWSCTGGQPANRGGRRRHQRAPAHLQSRCQHSSTPKCPRRLPATCWKPLSPSPDRFRCSLTLKFVCSGTRRANRKHARRGPCRPLPATPALVPWVGRLEQCIRCRAPSCAPPAFPPAALPGLALASPLLLRLICWAVDRGRLGTRRWSNLPRCRILALSPSCARRSPPCSARPPHFACLPARLPRFACSPCSACPPRFAWLAACSAPLLARFACRPAWLRFPALLCSPAALCF